MACFQLVATHGDKVPNHESDEIVAVFFAFHIAGMEVSRSGVLGQITPHVTRNRLRNFKMELFDDEVDLLNGLADLVIELDPDILTGWEVQLNSWGFVEARACTRGTSGSQPIQFLRTNKAKAFRFQTLYPVHLQGSPEQPL